MPMLRHSPRALRLAFAGTLTGALAGATPLPAQTAVRIGPSGAPSDPFCTVAALPATYGDVPGVIDFTWVGQRNGFGNTAMLSGGGALTGYGAGYSTLPCAIWGTNAATGAIGEFRMQPLGPTNSLRLDQVTFGLWSGSARAAQLRVYSDDLGTLLYTGFTVPIGPGVQNAPQTLLVNQTFTGPVRVQWDEPWYMGIGELRATVDPRASSVVPEPSTMALLGGGLAALAALRRRRRQA